MKKMLFCLLFLLVFVSVRASVDVGVWTDNFTNGLAFAEKENIPFVLVWGHQDCQYCQKLSQSLEQSFVQDWMREHPAVFVHKNDKLESLSDRSTWAPDNRAAAEWIDATLGDSWSFPMVGVYWPNSSGDVVKKFFVGRDGKMPVKTSELGLAGQFVESLDLYIGDYQPHPAVNFGARLPLIAAEQGVTQAMPFPVDLNGDGLPDLLVGVKIRQQVGYLGKIRVYLNHGSESEPEYDDFSYLKVNGEELVETQTAGGCQGLQAQFGDFNGDGYPDLAVGHLAGAIEVYPGTAQEGTYGEPIQLLQTTTVGASNRTYVCFYDRDGDGRDELFTGYMGGTFTMFDYDIDSGAWSTNAVTDSDGVALQTPEQSQASNRRTTPAFAEVSGSGYADLLSGSTDGNVYMFHSVTQGEWEAQCTRIVEGEANMERSRISVGDLNGDGIPDIIAGYNDGHVAWYKGTYGVSFSCEPADSYMPGVEIAPIPVSVTPAKYLPEVSAEGLPPGLSVQKVASVHYVVGTPTQPFSGEAKFTITYFRNGIKNVRTENVAFEISDYPILTLLKDPSSTGTGKLVGGGSGNVGKSLTVTATADSRTSASAGTTASVFAGWYCNGQPYLPEDGTDWRQPKLQFVMPAAAETVLYGRFIAKTDDAADDFSVDCVPDPAGYAPGQTMSPILISVDSMSYPTLSAKNLPTGVKLDATGFRLTGTPTKPGVYTSSLSAKNKSGKTVTTNVVIKVGNFTDEFIPVADEYGPFVPGVAQSFAIPEAIGCAASGLPSGMKFDKATGNVTGTPTKPGIYTVTFTKTVQRVSYSRKASASFIVAALPQLTIKATGSGSGTAKGAGAYVANRKLSLTATADKTSVFAGWFAEGEELSLSSKLSYVMPAEDKVLEARFVTKAEDQASIAMSLNGVEMTAGETVAVSNDCGVSVNWPVVATALSETTVKATGLPAGIKLVTDKTTGAISLSGAPTTASKLMADGSRTPSTVSLTVTSAGKSTNTYRLFMTILPRGEWSTGTYDGGVDCELGRGTVTATVAANGKVSGKYEVAGKSYSFSAASLSGVTEGGSYLAEVTVKIASGVTVTDTISLSPQTFDPSMPEIGLFRTDVSGGFAVLSNAVQNLWSHPSKSSFQLPTFASGASVTMDFDDAVDSGSLAFRFGAKGKVTVAGNVNGVKVSGSCQLLLDDIGPSACLCFAKSYNGRIVVSFPKAGFCRTFSFSGDYEVVQITTSDIVLDILTPGL